MMKAVADHSTVGLVMWIPRSWLSWRVGGPKKVRLVQRPRGPRCEPVRGRLECTRVYFFVFLLFLFSCGVGMWMVEGRAPSRDWRLHGNPPCRVLRCCCCYNFFSSTCIARKVVGRVMTMDRGPLGAPLSPSGQSTRGRCLGVVTCRCQSASDIFEGLSLG